MSQPYPPHDPPSISDDNDALTWDDLCKVCAVQSDFLLELMAEGVIEPNQGHAQETWRFPSVQLHQVSVAWRLQRDLGINPAGAALALQLMEEIHTLRAQLGQAGASADSA